MSLLPKKGTGGAKNEERKQFDGLVKQYLSMTEFFAKKATKKKLKADEVNDFCDFGCYKGCNVMGKILTICRYCLYKGIEPDIDYDLLRTKKIHILGKELTF